MAAYDISTNTRFEFDTQRGSYHSCYQIDSNHYINFWLGGATPSGYVQVFAVNTSTLEITTSGDSLEFDTNSVQYNNCIKIDTNHFVNFYSGEGSDGYAQVFTVNTSTWAVTTASILEFDTQSFSYSSGLILVDTNHLILSWASPVASYQSIQVFVINTSTFAITTAGSRFNYVSGNIIGNHLQILDATHFLNIYGGSGQDCFAQVFQVNTSTWEITTSADALEIDTDYADWPTSYKIDTNHFIVFYGGSGSDGYTEVLAIDTSTWAVTTTSARLEFDTVQASFNSCQKIDTNHFVNFWSINTSVGFTQVFTVNTSTWAVTTTNTRFQLDGTYAQYHSTWAVDSNNFIDFYNSNDQDGFAQIISVEGSPAPTTNTTNFFHFI